MRERTDVGSAESRLDGLDGRVRAALECALEGNRTSPAVALELLESEAPSEIAALLAVAGRLRTQHRGHTLTYSPKVFLPITNLCRDRCAYCTFRSDPDDPHSWTMLPEEVRHESRQAAGLGCIEGLMCLGDKPEFGFRSHRATLDVLGESTTVGYVARVSEIALEEGLLPHTNAGVMSTAEMRTLKDTNVSLGLMLENISPRLRGKGLAHYYAPDKDPARRMRMIDAAGELSFPFTTGILLGIGETASEVVASLEAIRETHDRHGHIQEIIIQNFRAKPTTRMAAQPEPTSVEMAKVIAVARLMMPEMSLQAPPNLSPYDHTLFIESGINDWGGISPVTPDFVNPEAPWPHVATLADTCRAQGFALRPRLPIYGEFIDRPGFVPAALRQRALERADALGVSL